MTAYLLVAGHDAALSVTVTVMGSTQQPHTETQRGSRGRPRLRERYPRRCGRGPGGAVRGLSICDAWLVMPLWGGSRDPRGCWRRHRWHRRRLMFGRVAGRCAQTADAVEIAIDIDCHRLPIYAARPARPRIRVLDGIFGGDDGRVAVYAAAGFNAARWCAEIGRGRQRVSCALTPRNRAIFISQTDAPDAAPAHIDGMATLIASGLGSGLSPFAPGTAVSSRCACRWALPQRFIGGRGGAARRSGLLAAGQRWGWSIIPRRSTKSLACGLAVLIPPHGSLRPSTQVVGVWGVGLVPYF